MPPPPAPPRSRGGPLLVVAASALATLPVWLTTFPPMVDYPQHLAMAAALRFYGDPARGFAETYGIAWGAPQALFEWLTAGLAWLLPIEIAGKLVVALALAAVGPAALVLVRRLGKPDWYAVLPLAAMFNYAYSWGFVGTLFAYPLFLVGVAAADRLLPQPGGRGRFGAGAWLLLAALTLSFYLVHLQLLLLFAAAVAWLVAVRRPGWRRAAAPLVALLPGVLVVAAVVLLPNLVSPAESFSPYEQSMKAVGARWRSLPLKLSVMPGLVFGSYPGLKELAVAALAAGLGLVVARRRRREPERGKARDRLFRDRFAWLAAALFALYLLLPERFMGYLVAERLAPLAGILALVSLPAPRGRAVVAKALAAALLVVSLGLATAQALAFERDAAGLAGLLRAAAPGRRLAGVVYDPYAEPAGAGPLLLRYPLYTHFPALYQALRGGRVLFSFAELSHSLVRYRPGREWPPDLLARVADRHPRAFSLPRDGPRFDYLLARGERAELPAVLGPGLAAWDVRSAGRWHLLHRRHFVAPSAAPSDWTGPRSSGTLPSSAEAVPPGGGGLYRQWEGR
ncbi:MAG TPA: hypothetical protein VF121_01785 [Thermoanaerobaculia bacterium]|nr:hypothetical protein [Thermoanaerobaculia bacterium]